MPRAAGSPASRSWSRRRTIVFALMLTTLLGAAGATLQLSQSDAATQLEDRFRLRVGLGTGFVRSYFDDVAARAREVATAELFAEQPPEGELGRVARTLGFDVAVLLDSGGRLIQIVPDRPELVGTEIASQYEHLTAAVAGQVTVSGVVLSAAESLPVLAVAVPYETAHGRRILSGGFNASHTPLAAYLQASIPFTTAGAYIADSSGTVAASNLSGTTAPEQPTLPAGLLAAMAGHESGYYTDGGTEHFFTAEPIAGTPLRLITTVATASLYAPVQGLGSWLPWLVLACLALVAAYLVVVLARLAQAQSRLKLASVELERSNRELNDFAAIASHDLQEPLRKIQSFGDRLATRAAGTLDEDATDYLGRMQDAAARMQQLINELLTYSRVTTRPEPLARVDLNRTVAEILEDLEVRVAATGGSVAVGPLPAIMASPLQMRQLFQNLVGNALKFHRDGVPPVVQIRAHPPTGRAGELEVTVSDNGVGFDDQYAEQIFAPFQRLHARSAFEGTGMGLAICRRIVERHGGTLTAASTPGAGTTFTIRWPAKLRADQGPLAKAARGRVD